MNDLLIERLARLASAAPSESQAWQVRARCHRALARRRRREAKPWRRATRYWPHLVAGLGGLYFAETVRRMLDGWPRF
jgi:hypothetical protein